MNLNSLKRIAWLPMVLAMLACAMLVAPATAHADATTFAILSDTHVRGQGDNGAVTNNADALRAFKWTKGISGLDAVIVAGDLTDRGYPSDFVTYNSLWKKADVSVPRIQCIGNHDTNHGGSWNGLSVASCASHFRGINNGKITDYQEFDNANVMTIGGPYRGGGSGVYTKKMLKQLNKNLKKTVRQGKMAIVVSHYPYTTSFANSARMLSILKSYPNVIFVSGHVHYYPSSKWVKKVKPKSIKKKTPYKRAGIKAKKIGYAFKSLGVDSVARNHSVGGFWQSSGQSIGCMLNVGDDGRIVYKRYNMKNGKCLKTWKMKQTRGSVTIKPISVTKGKNGTLTYRVTFSDGKQYGGIQSGGTFNLKTGAKKKIKGIPAGVLVTVQCVSAPAGWSKAKKAKIEITNKNRNVTIKHSYKKPKNQPKTSSTQPTSSSSVVPSESTQSSSEGEDPVEPIDDTSSSTSSTEESQGSQDSPAEPESSSSASESTTEGSESSSSAETDPPVIPDEGASESESADGADAMAATNLAEDA